jgi:hypothetical protein
MIAEREPGTEFSQIVGAYRLTARHAERLEPRCPAIDEDEPHAVFLGDLIDLRPITMQIATMVQNETPEIRPLLHLCGVWSAV